jgi:ABC-type Mn2+/Zn2+ transport system permease subunit
MRTAALELALLAVSGGVLGAWIVLRRLAFFTHAVGAAAFPALVVAVPLGVSPQLAGVAAGLGYAAGVERAGRGGRDLSVPTGLLLVACLATGVVLASDVVEAPTGVDQLLFGTLLGLDSGDLALSGVAAVLAVGGTLALRSAWLATGFDPEGAHSLGVPTRATDASLLAIVAAAAVAAVPAVGALLVTSLFIVPAATARLLTSTTTRLVAASVCLAALQGLAGLYMAFALDVSPGPAVAVLGACLYALAAAGRWVGARPRGSRPSSREAATSVGRIP